MYWGFRCCSHPFFVAREQLWHAVSFCSSWLPAWRAAVSSVISQKWETQLKWQVAASSCYDKWAEMLCVTGSGASTAAESLSLERTGSTSGGLNSVYPRLGTPFPRHLICKSTKKFDLWNNEASRRSAKCLWSCSEVSWWSNTEVGTDLGPLLNSALFLKLEQEL